MVTVKYAVLKHWMNTNGNRVSKILVVFKNNFAIFNLQCYEHQIPEYVRWKLKLEEKDELIEIKQIKP